MVNVREFWDTTSAKKLTRVSNEGTSGVPGSSARDSIFDRAPAWQKLTYGVLVTVNSIRKALSTSRSDALARRFLNDPERNRIFPTPKMRKQNVCYTIHYVRNLAERGFERAPRTDRNFTCIPRWESPPQIPTSVTSLAHQSICKRFEQKYSKRRCPIKRIFNFLFFWRWPLSLTKIS